MKITPSTAVKSRLLIDLSHKTKQHKRRKKKITTEANERTEKKL